MKYKLVIFDFDGVIADSEKIYLENRLYIVNKFFNLNWDFNTAITYLGGQSDSSNKSTLDKLGYATNDKFWKELYKLDSKKINSEYLRPTDDIENLIKKLPKTCVATGGIFNETIKKLDIIGFWNKYFNEKNIFTVDMVKKGKPEPDLFLLAAEKMGEKPENCIVIEDSIVGITAAKKAGMEVIAFLGCEIYRSNEYLDKVKKCDVKYICYSMKEVEDILMR